jgi:hypothetical protein
VPTHPDNPADQIHNKSPYPEEGKKDNEYRLPREDDAFIPMEEWSKVQEIKKHEPPQETNTFIPVEEWSKFDGADKNMPRREAEVFISAERLANPEIIKKEETPVAKETVQKTETINFAFKKMKSCRFCRGEIDSDAIKCEHCGRMLSERTVRKIIL